MVTAPFAPCGSLVSFLTHVRFGTQPVLNDHRPRALRLTDRIEDKPLMGIRGLVRGLHSVELGTLAISVVCAPSEDGQPSSEPNCLGCPILWTCTG